MENEIFMKSVTVLQKDLKQFRNFVLQTGYVCVVFIIHDVECQSSWEREEESESDGDKFSSEC
jgi:hypothetical protein